MPIMLILLTISSLTNFNFFSAEKLIFLIVLTILSKILYNQLNRKLYKFCIIVKNYALVVYALFIGDFAIIITKIFKFCLIFSLISYLSQNPSKNECQPRSNGDLYSDDEEEKEHEAVSHNIKNFIDERSVVANDAARINMEYSGVAGMFGFGENSKPFSEEREHEHSANSVDLINKNSPGNSPGLGTNNILKGAFESIEKDSNEAFDEDISQMKNVWSEAIKTAVESAIAGGGTNMNCDDDMSDIF